MGVPVITHRRSARSANTALATWVVCVLMARGYGAATRNAPTAADESGRTTRTDRLCPFGCHRAVAREDHHARGEDRGEFLPFAAVEEEELQTSTRTARSLCAAGSLLELIGPLAQERCGTDYEGGTARSPRIARASQDSAFGNQPGAFVYTSAGRIDHSRACLHAWRLGGGAWSAPTAASPSFRRGRMLRTSLVPEAERLLETLLCGATPSPDLCTISAWNAFLAEAVVACATALGPES
eukprot:scaffold62451_cov28-Tisochrysis_lutea.AAC.3